MAYAKKGQQSSKSKATLSPDSLSNPLENLKLGSPRRSASPGGSVGSQSSNKYSRHSTEFTKSPQPRRQVARVSNQKTQTAKHGKSNPDGKVVQKPKGTMVGKPQGLIAPKGYTCRPIVPASKAELLPVAHAMHGEDFAPKVKKLFDPEREAAIEAIQTGVYIGWRCPSFKHDCIRVGRNSKCFCGHNLSEHDKYNGRSVRVPCVVSRCACKAFAFVPSRAEDVGEWWLQRRITFDPSTWRAKCKCKHTHEEHVPHGMRRCLIRGCGCSQFYSNFLCCACDRHWEDHETFFETEGLRKEEGIPYGEAYLPFHEFPELRDVVLTGRKDDDSQYRSLTSGPFAIPDNTPTDLALQLRGENPNGRPQYH